ncbi:hypothetical protein [Sporosarcina cyprini]|uniref:hypothetical protein n=1 Tax=Sporosarcina cyprini TaxID=2910523 RepID=UPI001EDE156D|nr:hypothetical protein [Sporosarcina cyprini]MCG3087669.1 hypothetical protein [Sporosarcina cyprini]
MEIYERFAAIYERLTGVLLVGRRQGRSGAWLITGKEVDRINERFTSRYERLAGRNERLQE